MPCRIDDPRRLTDCARLPRANATREGKTPVDRADTKRKCRLAIPRSRFRRYVLFEITCNPLLSEWVDDHWRRR
jgi:hypothetical protein